VEIGVAQRPALGESLCGDAFAIVPCGRTTLVALADGLGHGPEAARAAQTFCSHAESAAHAPLAEIFASADRAVSGTRGVAAALLRLEPAGHFEFAGVGNVVARVLGRAQAQPLSVAGTIGRRTARRARCERFPVQPGDVLVMHTDGIAGHWDLEARHAATPELLAQEILDLHGRSHDDATCLVVRFDGEALAGPRGDGDGEGAR
jgi:serine/threonine protein phosphatase PrpC